MNYKLQLLSFFASFLFGVFFSFANEVHYTFVKRQRKVLQFFLTFFFIVIMVLLYITIFYYLNHGIFHIYFLLVMLLGYCVSISKVKVLICRVKSIIHRWKSRKK